jgi:hypothetical protein
MTDAPPDAAYTGALRRGIEPGTVRGFLVDRLGTRIEITGTKDPRPGHGYLLIGTVRLPAHLEVEGLDTP